MAGARTFGSVPKEAARLTEELDQRGLKVASGAVHGFRGLTGPVDLAGNRPDHPPGRRADQLRWIGRPRDLRAVTGYRDDKGTGASSARRRLDASHGRP